MAASSKAYFSVATVKVNPTKISEVIACFDEIAKATKEKEPGAQIYRYFRTGDDMFVWISKFDSREAYDAHQNSAHVQAWVEKYPDRNPAESELYNGPWIFYEMVEEASSGGFERA